MASCIDTIVGSGFPGSDLPGAPRFKGTTPWISWPQVAPVSLFSPANLSHTGVRISAPPVALGERFHRPWGWFETLATGNGYLVKRLLIAAHRRISLQRHHHRSEHWVVVAGSGVLERDGERISAEAGTSLFVPCGSVHRATADASALEIIEVQRGDVLREDDIERFEDDYGRVIR
jgi:mannose-6-phosphate isomerase